MVQAKKKRVKSHTTAKPMCSGASSNLFYSFILATINQKKNLFARRRVVLMDADVDRFQRMDGPCGSLRVGGIRRFRRLADRICVFFKASFHQIFHFQFRTGIKTKASKIVFQLWVVLEYY